MFACRKCGPRLSAAAAEKLKNRYVVMRSGAREHERETDKRPSIPITVRCVSDPAHELLVQWLLMRFSLHI